jgi:putative FmdB family regulatory protein
MTLYEYRCKQCRTVFTERRPSAERNEPATCPQCGGPGAKIISRPQPFKFVWSRERHPEELRNTPEIWE